MAIPAAGKPSGAPRQPVMEPKSAPKKPADNKAAKEAPRETMVAAKNAFGEVPKGGNASPADASKSTAPAAATKDATPAQEPKPPAKDPDPAPKTPITTNPAGPQPKSNLTLPAGSPNATLPPPAPPTDPKAGIPETPPADPEVDKALNTRGGNGKTAAEEATGRTMEDLRKYTEDLKGKGLPGDAVAKYFKLKQAEVLVKQGIPTGADPKDPTVPAIPGTPGESGTRDIFDTKKIEGAIKAAENDPEVQQWLARQQARNQEAILDERIKNGEMTDIPKDPLTGQRIDYLRNKQAEYLKNPEVAKAIARLPGDKIAEALAKATAPFSPLGATGKESREQLYKLIDKVTDITGAPKPLVDDNFDPVRTPDGNTVIKDPASGKGVALDKTGKVINDATTGLPAVIGKDGNPVVDAYRRPVVITGSGYAVVQDKDGTMQVVGTDKYGNENMPLTNPDNTLNRIVIDRQTDLPVELDAKSGLPLADTQSGLPRVVDVNTGKTVTNPANGNVIVADKDAGMPVEIDAATGKIVADAEGNPVVVNPATGYQVWDKNGVPVVVDRLTRMPLIVDPKTGIRTIANPKTGTPLLDPLKGTTAILDPDSKLPVAAITSKESGEIIKNTNGLIAQLDESTGLPVLVDPKTGDKSIVDANTGYVVQDPKGNALYVDKSSGLAVGKDANGKDVTEGNSRAKLVYDPKTGIPIGDDARGTVVVVDPRSSLPVEVNAADGMFTKDADGNTVVVSVATGQPQKTPDGKAVVIGPKANLAVAIVDGNYSVVNPYTGEYVTNKESGAGVMIDPKSGSPVFRNLATGGTYTDPATGGLQVVDPKTGDALTDVDGNVVQIDPKTGAPAVWDKESSTFKATAPLPVPVTDANGNQVTTADGHVLAKDGATGNNILIDPKTNQPVDGPAPGMRQLADQNGNVLKDAGGNFVVQDKESGRPVAVDATGNRIVDAQGNALVYNLQGKQVTDANGNPVVIDENSGATILTTQGTGAPIVDKAGNVYVANSETGGAVTDPETGNVVVLDKESKAPVVAGADGTVYKDAAGNAFLADLVTGKARMDVAGNNIVVDKNVGLPVVVDPKTGIKTVVGNNGEPLKDPKTGAVFEVGKNGLPQLVQDNGNGERIVIDPKTGKQMEIDGNKVYIDPKTGLTVMNHPAYGMIDIVSGEAPAPTVDGAPPLYGEKVYLIWKAVRAGVGAIYRTTFGIFGGQFSKFAEDAFFQNTKNFHASRMVSSLTGLVGMVMTGLRWAPGTEMLEKLQSGDARAISLFAEDMTSTIKYFGFYPKTTASIMKVLFDPVAGKAGVKLALDNKTLYRVDPGGGASVYVERGQVNPFTGVKSESGGWVQAPSGSFNPVDGVVNPLTGPAPAPGTVRAVPDAANPLLQGFERWDAQSRRWVYVGNNPAGLPPGVDDPNYFNNRPAPPDPVPTWYGKLASSKLFNVIKTSASVLMGLGNVLGGGLQIYRGGYQISDAIKTDNPLLGVAGGINLVAGSAYLVSGLGSIGTALGIVGTIGSAIAGVGMAIANIGSLIALIVELTSDPNAMKHPGEVWANKVTDEFKDVDIFTPDANRKLQEWYKQFATDYWARKRAEDSLYEPKYDA